MAVGPMGYGLGLKAAGVAPRGRKRASQVPARQGGALPTGLTQPETALGSLYQEATCLHLYPCIETSVQGEVQQTHLQEPESVLSWPGQGGWVWIGFEGTRAVGFLKQELPVTLEATLLSGLRRGICKCLGFSLRLSSPGRDLQKTMIPELSEAAAPPS